MKLNEIEQIVLLADGHLLDGDVPPDQIDANTFAKLLIVDNLINCENSSNNEGLMLRHDINVIIEILTPETENIIAGFKNCSHIVGPLVTSRFITTFTIYPKLEKLFKVILSSDEVDIVIVSRKNILNMLQTFPNSPKILTFNDLLQNRPKNAIPLGWVLPEKKSGGISLNAKNIRLNPAKNEKIPEEKEDVELIYLWRKTS